MMRHLAAGCAALALAACGTTSGPLGPLPEIADKATAAKVVVVRVSSVIGAANGYTVSFDGKDLFGIGSGEHVEFPAAPGEHMVTVGCFGGLAPVWNEASVKFTAVAGATSYFLVSPSVGCVEIRAVTHAEAAVHLQSSRSVSAPSAPEQTARQGTAPSAVPVPREVPALKVVADCGACQVKDTVPALIAEGYAAAAAEYGVKVTTEPGVTVAIREYAARDAAARFILGILAGRDVIKAAVTVKERSFVVEDYYQNAWLGIDELAKNIGQMVFHRVNPEAVAAGPARNGAPGEAGTAGRLGNSPEFRKGRRRDQGL